MILYGGGDGNGGEYISAWVAGTHPAQTMCTHLGYLWINSAETSDEPIPPQADYGNDFTTVPAESFWMQGGLTGPQTITAISGQTVGTSGETTALRLYGIGAAGGGDFYIEVTLDWATSGTVLFFDSIDSELNWDKATFSIDGAVQHEIHGSVAWTERTYNVAPGTHTLRWRFRGDSGVGGSADHYLIGALRTTGTEVGSGSAWNAVAVTPAKVAEMIATALAE